MSYSFIWIVIFVQILIALVVAIVLKKILNRELLELAVQQFERMRLDEEASKVGTIKIISSKPLPEKLTLRLKTASEHHFQKAFLNFECQAGLQGGMIIHLGIETLDFSLKSRWRHLWKT